MNRDQLKKLENQLWSAADTLRANSDLKASEYSTLAPECQRLTETI
jgi:type I restriction enzyme M protein